MNARPISCACGDGPLAIRLACVLEQQLSAEEAGEALERALVAAGFDAIPDEPEELVFFATGPLHEALQSSFGRERANQFMLDLAPLLDAAWEAHDRARITPTSHTTMPPTSAVVRRDSAWRDKDAAAGWERAAVSDEIAKADTIPAPSSPSSERAGRALTAPAVSPIDVSDKPPSSRRFTVPYLPKALVRRGRTPTAVVVDADETTREELSDWLRSAGCLVATAATGAEARSLLRRTRAGLLIADVETIAPDYEPIAPVLDDMLRELDPPTILLLSEDPSRIRCPLVSQVLAKPSDRVQLVAAIAAHLERVGDLRTSG